MRVPYTQVHTWPVIINVTRTWTTHTQKGTVISSVPVHHHFVTWYLCVTRWAHGVHSERYPVIYLTTATNHNLNTGYLTVVYRVHFICLHTGTRYLPIWWVVLYVNNVYLRVQYVRLRTYSVKHTQRVQRMYAMLKGILSAWHYTRRYTWCAYTRNCTRTALVVTLHLHHIRHMSFVVWWILYA